MITKFIGDTAHGESTKQETQHFVTSGEKKQNTQEKKYKPRSHFGFLFCSHEPPSSGDSCSTQATDLQKMHKGQWHTCQQQPGPRTAEFT